MEHMPPPPLAPAAMPSSDDTAAEGVRCHTVALLSPPFASWTYARPPWLAQDACWRAGLRVAVPLGNGQARVGVLLEDGLDNAALPAGVTPRPMIWPLEADPLLSVTHLELARQLALRQMVTVGRILTTMLPVGLRLTKQTLRVFTASGGKPRLWGLRELRSLSLQAMRELQAQAAQSVDMASLQPQACPACAALLALAQDWQQGQAQWLLPREDAAATEVCVLLKDPPWALRPNAVRQRLALEYLLEHGAVSRRQLGHALGTGSASILAGLVRHGLVAIRAAGWADVEEEEAVYARLLPPLPESFVTGTEAADPATPDALSLTPASVRQTDAGFVLSTPQQEALDACCAVLESGQAATRLLYGVTGSGKTAVYVQLAKACLERGKSLLLLAPEVALAMKLRRDVRVALPDAPLFFTHGYQSTERRERTFRALAVRKEPCIIVGTRSALFLPVPVLGAVALDEEHDASFKQDEGLTYQAKEVAWFRASQAGALLVLGSATPDVKTFYAVQQGQIPMDRLPQRVGGGTLPDIRLVDIRTANVGESVLAPDTLTALRATMERGEQAVILLNRRGYAPLMYCLDCGKVARCPHCEIGLTYHKGREKLVCHYCGYSVPFPVLCPHCKGLHYLPMGQGTERLEEHIATILPPGGRVLRLDRDTTRRPGRMEEILESFARQEAQVLVGTQMLSKGHHFPQVTLAVVADADMGLNLPDYRAAERTFQLLVQSAGRAGRGQKPGQVIIQTRDTSHYCWQFVQHADYDQFYAHEIALRAKRRYPPFVRLAMLRMNFPLGWAEGAELVATLSEQLRTAGRANGVTVLGPAPAPLPMLRGRRRYQCLLKAEDWPSIRAVYAAVLPLVKGELRMGLDLDPVNML